MPDLGISEIIAIASLVAGAASTGVSVYEAGQQRDAQKDLLKQQQQQAAQAELVQKQKALATAGAQSQSQTGGSLTGAAGQSFADILAGYAGLQGSQGGSTNSPQANAVSSNNQSQNPLETLLAALKGGQQQQSSSGDFSGGVAPPPPPNQNKFNLSQLNLG